MQMIDLNLIPSEVEQARLARVAEQNRAAAARERAAMFARAEAERAREQAVLAARAGRLAAVAERLVERLRADPELLRWVDPDRIVAPGEPLPPADVPNYRTSIEVSLGTPRGDGTGGVVITVRAADPNVCERLLAEETDPVSAALAGRERATTSDGPLRDAVHRAGVGARILTAVRVDERVVDSARFDADLGRRVQVLHGHYTRHESISVAIGTDLQPGGPTKPARVMKDGWTSSGGRRAGIGAD